MKRVLFLAVLAVLAIQLNAQRLRFDIDAAKYVAYDSTSFTLGAVMGTKLIIVDFATLNANDAVLHIGNTGEDGIGAGYVSYTGGTTADSTILNVTTNTHKERKSDGTRVSYTRAYFWFDSGIPSYYVKFTFVWNSVTTGHVKIYY